MNNFTDYVLKNCPKIREIIENKKDVPTTEDRLEALENAVADLTLQSLGVEQ
ncbi:MAG: hypothetical protein ACI4IK_02880 [Eubacterium sp.]